MRIGMLMLGAVMVATHIRRRHITPLGVTIFASYPLLRRRACNPRVLLGVLSIFLATHAVADNLCEWRAGYQKYRADHPTIWSKYTSYRQCFPERANAVLANDVGACNFFVARVLTEAGISGLRYSKNDPRALKKEGEGAYLLAYALYEELGRRSGPNGDFEALGEATRADANAAAQARANAGKLVVAINPEHVALVIPGEQSPSASWAPVRPPMSASWFIDKIDKGYVGCPLSSAFTKPAGVRLYATK